MAKRDPEKTKINKEISSLTEEIKRLLPVVLNITQYESEQSLNGTYGGKYADYIDIKNEVIDTPDQFISLYFKGFLQTLEERSNYICTEEENTYYRAFLHVKNHGEVLKWLELFLRRTYLRNYEAFSKKKPPVEEAEIWIGQKNASYGILVTPRFKDGCWENDKSEIRHFKPKYWTIGHVINTGLVIPNEEEKMNFKDIEQYLSFFKNTLVRNSGSQHEKEIAKRYCDFVRTSEIPENVPLLIPELRYKGTEKKHQYRLDFTVINPYNLSKVGFELSPWSTHGKLIIKDKKPKEINDEAQKNFEKEMEKLKAYFRKFSITVLVYTDANLKDYDAIFEEIAKYLSPTESPKQLKSQVIEEFLAFTIPCKS